MTESHAVVAHHFEDLEQQHEASTLGMWTFLATEVLFFGGLFFGFLVYRAAYAATFAEAARHLYESIGAINTVILLSSSLTVALAVHAGAAKERRRMVRLLVATLSLGLLFLVLKALEYYLDYQEQLVPRLNFTWEGAHAPQAELFFTFYFIMTAIHALHVIIGISVATVMAFLARRGWYDQDYTPIEVFALYWHFVDIVWIFLFPLLYLLKHA